MRIESVENQTAASISRVAAEAAAVMQRGGLVVFPTETVYGIAAAADSDAGLARLRRFKQRPDDQPFTVHLPDRGDAKRYVDVVDGWLRRLIERALPGPMTIIVDVPESTIHAKLGELGWPTEARDRLYHGCTIGLRCPDQPIAQQALRAVDGPVVASSANPRGQTPPLDAQQAAAMVGDAAELIIDAGRTRHAKPSTIVRVQTVDGRLEWSLVRPGVYDQRYIEKLMRWTIVFLCTGNTCRSPMAEGLAKRALAQRRGVDPGALAEAGVRVLSAGVSAFPGSSASAEAVHAMSRLDIDISGHRAQRLDREMILDADAIYCMTESHRQSVLHLVPTASEKTRLLDPSGDVVDPIGSDQDTYQRCAEQIMNRITEHFEKLGI